MPIVCIHHWLLPKPSGATVEGRCADCGARREFYAEYELCADAGRIDKWTLQSIEGQTTSIRRAAAADRRRRERETLKQVRARAMLAEAERGTTYADIARKFGLKSAGGIATILKEQGYSRTLPRDLDRDLAITSAYIDGTRSRDLAEQFGLTKAQVDVIVARMGGVEARREQTVARWIEWESRRKAGATLAKIASEYGVTISAVSLALRKHLPEARASAST